MDADRLAVTLVIQTASGVLTRRFAPREAVTILATQVPRARSGGIVLAERDPGWSAAHAELLVSISTELATRLEGEPHGPELAAVLSELDRVVQALGSSSTR